MTDSQNTHGHDCWGWGPKHYECAAREAMVERIAALLYEEATGDPWTVAGIEHPGPADRDYYRGLARKVAALAAQQPADDEVVFIDGVGAGRSSIKSCRDGVQWIRVGDRVYWPLSDSDAKRLHSACCGNGSFDGPASTLPSAPVGMEAIREAFDEISGLCRYLRQGGPAPEDLQDLSDALDEAVGIAANMLHTLAQQPAAPSEDVNVAGMPEFDGLLDHIYEYGTASEGVIEKANAFARAVIARYAPQQPAAVDGNGMKAPSEPCDDAVAYIELLLRANREAGLAILPRHLTILLAMLRPARASGG